MKQILDNPYRIIGLLVGATAREQEKQIRRLKQFIEAEQEPQDDFSFPKLGQLNRTVGSVAEAASKLNLDSDKINAAIFWFYNGSHTDEPAFDAIKVGDLDQVLNIWSKLTGTADVSQRNASAYNNLSTLYLSSILDGTNSKEAIFEKGISLKLKFLESDFIKDFKALATDETFKTTKKELQLIFLNQVQSEVDKNGGVNSQRFLEILNRQNFSAKEDFLKGFVQKPIEQIERKIEEAKNKRKANKADAESIGKALFKHTSESLLQLKSILGISNIKFSSITDKVSDELLQCGIDYFQYNRDNTENSTGIPKEHSTYTGGSSNGHFAEASMDLFRKAKALALGNIAKQRCQENTEHLQEWIDGEPEREKQKVIGVDLKFITSKLERVKTLSDTVANARELVDSCKPRLVNIKNALGSTDDLYIKISSAVVGNAQGMLVSAVNDEQKSFSTYRNISNLKSTINEAYNLTISLSSMDMLPNLRTQFNKNKEVITGIKNQIFNATASTAEKFGRTAGELAGKVRSGTSGSSSGGGGCYIATMAYGNYDHPQVMVLRRFRDEVLSKSKLGKCFIITYYHYSPKMVEKMKNKKMLNALIRSGLNQFIKLIK